MKRVDEDFSLVSWRVWNFMSPFFCLYQEVDALKKFDSPNIMNALPTNGRIFIRRMHINVLYFSKGVGWMEKQ